MGYQLVRGALVAFIRSEGDGGVMSYANLLALESLPGYFSHSLNFPEGAPLRRTVNSDTHVGAVAFVHGYPSVLSGALSAVRRMERNRAFELFPEPTPAHLIREGGGAEKDAAPEGDQGPLFGGLIVVGEQETTPDGEAGTAAVEIDDGPTAGGIEGSLQEGATTLAPTLAIEIPPVKTPR